MTQAITQERRGALECIVAYDLRRGTEIWAYGDSALFARLTWRHRQPRHAVATTTFLRLVTVFGLRLWAPELMLNGVAVHQLLRWAAWTSAAVSLVLLVRLRLRRSG